MSSANPSHCVCPTPVVVDVPGAPGVDGAQGVPGINGSDGINPFTLVATGFTIPTADGVTPVTVNVLTSVWGVVGENIFIQTAGVFQITAIPSTSQFTCVYLPYSVNTVVGTVSAGAGVTPTGYQPKLTGITALTDSTGGTSGTTLAAGTGFSTLSFYMTAPDILTGDLLTTYLPGYAFKLWSFDARCAKPITTATHASNVSLKISGAAVTGGVIALSGTYVQGAAQAGSAIIGAQVGAATDTITISATTSSAFIEGAVWLIIRIQNLDTANSISSLANRVNAIRSQLS